MVAPVDYSTGRMIFVDLTDKTHGFFFPGKLVRELVLDALSPIAHAEKRVVETFRVRLGTGGRAGWG